MFSKKHFVKEWNQSKLFAWVSEIVLLLLIDSNNFIYKGNISTAGPVFVQTMKFVGGGEDTSCDSAEMSFSRYANSNKYPDDMVNIFLNVNYKRKNAIFPGRFVSIYGLKTGITSSKHLLAQM